MGTKIEEEDLAKVKVGRTTLSQLESLFGKPNNLMDTTNTAPGYYSKNCGEKDSDIRVAQYMHVKAVGYSTQQSGVDFLLNDKKVVCGIRRNSGGFK